jgi:hypothetical protein
MWSGGADTVDGYPKALMGGDEVDTTSQFRSLTRAARSTNPGVCNRGATSSRHSCTTSIPGGISPAAAKPVAVFTIADAPSRPDFKSPGLLDTATGSARSDSECTGDRLRKLAAVHGYDVRAEERRGGHGRLWRTESDQPGPSHLRLIDTAAHELVVDVFGAAYGGGSGARRSERAAWPQAEVHQ